MLNFYDEPISIAQKNPYLHDGTAALRLYANVRHGLIFVGFAASHENVIEVDLKSNSVTKVTPAPFSCVSDDWVFVPTVVDVSV